MVEIKYDASVTGPPTITNPLTDQVIEFNERITLNCAATGDGTITYQWQEFSNGSWMDINNSNNVEYTTDTLTQSSQLRCVVTNEAGMTISSATISALGEHKYVAVWYTRMPYVVKKFCGKGIFWLV